MKKIVSSNIKKNWLLVSDSLILYQRKANVFMIIKAHFIMLFISLGHYSIQEVLFTKFWSPKSFCTLGKLFFYQELSFLNDTYLKYMVPQILVLNAFFRSNQVVSNFKSLLKIDDMRNLYPLFGELFFAKKTFSWI